MPYKCRVDLSVKDNLEAIGVYRCIHSGCIDGFTRLGQSRLIYQPKGQLNYSIACEKPVRYLTNSWVQSLKRNVTQMHSSSFDTTLKKTKKQVDV